MKHFSAAVFFGGLLALALMSGDVNAQEGVRIGPAPATAPDASAALDIVTNSTLKKGLLIPRLAAADRGTMTAPAQGLIVYQTDGSTTGGEGSGFWYNQGTSVAPKWLRLTDSNGVSYSPGTGLQVGPGPALAGSGTVGNPATTTTGTFFFRGSVPDFRVGVLYRASDLLAAGLAAGPLTSISFSVLTKASTAPYLGLTLKLAGTTASDVAGGLLAVPLTTVYTAPPAGYATQAEWNAFPFSTAFSWNGTDNIYLELCYDNVAGNSDDFTRVAPTSPTYVARYTLSDAAGATSGCALTTASPGVALVTSVNMPVTRFGQVSNGYTLPAGGGTPGQVLTQQVGGAVSFQDPQWTQSGTNLFPTTSGVQVGVGTTAPVARLTVEAATSTGGGEDDIVLRAYGANAAPGLAVQRFRGTPTAPLGVQNGDFLGTMGFGMGLAGGGSLFVRSGMQSFYRGAGATGLTNLHLFTSGVTRLAIDESGNVGIGTTTPFSMLANTADNVIGSNGIGGFPKSLTWAATEDAYAALVYNGGTTSQANGLAVKIDGSNPATTALDVSRGTQAAVGTPLFSVRPSGRVGIGSNNPDVRLLVLADNSTGGADDDVVLRAYGASAGPAYTIQRARGTEAAPLALQAGDFIGFYGFGPRTTGGQNFATSGLQSNYQGDGTTGLSDLSLFTSGFTRFSIDETGKVGIGVTDPVSRLANTTLDIMGADGTGTSPSQSLSWVNSTVGYTAAFYNTNATATGRNGLAVKIAGNTATNIALDVSQGTAQATAGTSLLHVRGDGRVGIGTDTPDSRLDVAGTLTVSGTTASEVNRTQTGAANLLPICYGNVSSNGTVNTNGSTSNFTVSHTVGSGTYAITITGVTFLFSNYNTTATMQGGIPGMVAAGSNVSAQLVISTFNSGGADADRAFNFVVYKP